MLRLFQEELKRKPNGTLSGKSSSNVFGQKRNSKSKRRKEFFLIKGLVHCPLNPIIVMKKT
jgi:hypothetical protein